MKRMTYELHTNERNVILMTCTWHECNANDARIERMPYQCHTKWNERNMNGTQMEWIEYEWQRARAAHARWCQQVVTPRFRWRWESRGTLSRLRKPWRAPLDLHCIPMLSRPDLRFRVMSQSRSDPASNLYWIPIKIGPGLRFHIGSQWRPGPAWDYVLHSNNYRPRALLLYWIPTPVLCRKPAQQGGGG